MKEKCLKIINNKVYPIILMIIGYFIDIIYVALNGNNLINSDSAAEMMLGNLLNKTGGFITDKWYYSSELRVVNTQIVYKLALFLFSNNWNYAKTFSVAVFLLVLLLSALFLVHISGIKNAGLWWCCALVFPFGQWYAWNVIYNSYYIPHIVISLISISLVIAFSKKTSNCKRQVLFHKFWQLCFHNYQHLSFHRFMQMILLIAMGITGFLAGLGGTRQLMVCYCPLFFASLIYLFLRRDEEKNNPFLNQNYQQKCRLFYGSAIMLVASVIGYLVNNRILSKLFSFNNYADTKWSMLDFNSVISCLSDLVSLFGWQEDLTVLSLRGIANVIGLAIGISSLLLMIYAFRRLKKYNTEMGFVVLFCNVSVVLCLMIFSQIIDTYNLSYWLPILPFIMLVFIMELGGMMNDTSKLLGYFGYIAMLILCSYSTMKNPCIISIIPSDLYIHNTVAFLEDNGYTEGYGTFWNSDVITELSNGDIEMRTVDNLDTLNIYEWLQETDHKDTQPTGKVFIICSKDEYNSGINDWKIKALTDNLVYQDETYYVYGFENVQQYFELINY